MGPPVNTVAYEAWGYSRNRAIIITKFLSPTLWVGEPLYWGSKGACSIPLVKGGAKAPPAKPSEASLL